MATNPPGESKRILWYLLLTSIFTPIVLVITGIGATNYKVNYFGAALGSLFGLLILVLIFRISRAQFHSYNHQPLRLHRLFLTILLSAFFTLVPVISGFLYLFSTHQCYSTPLPPIKDFLSLFIMGVVIAPIEEEIFFRGILFRFFQRKYSLLLSMVLTTIIFSLTHLDPSTFFYTFIFGLVAAFLYHRWGNLAYPLIFHALYNGLPQVCGLVFLINLPQ